MTDAAPWDALDQDQKDAWNARAEAADHVLTPYFAPYVVGLGYRGSHSAFLTLWLEGITKDVGLVTLPEVPLQDPCMVQG